MRLLGSYRNWVVYKLPELFGDIKFKEAIWTLSFLRLVKGFH